MTKKAPAKKGGTSRKDPTAQYIIILGGVVVALGLVSLVLDLFGRWFFTSIILTVLALGGIIWGNRLYDDGDGPSPVFGGVVIFIAAILFGLDIVSINKMFGEPLPSVSYILFIATALYFVLAYFFANHLVLILAVISFFAYLAYIGGGFWGWLPFVRGGVNSHTYIALASPLVILAGFIQEKFINALKKGFDYFERVYYFMGFLFLNTSLWMLSLFGRDLELFRSRDTMELILFTGLFFLANIATIVFGGIKKDRSFVTFGAIFLTLNILTRFTDLFFEEVGRSALFIIAGALMIVVGLVLERLLRNK